MLKTMKVSIIKKYFFTFMSKSGFIILALMGWQNDATADWYLEMESARKVEFLRIRHSISCETTENPRGGFHQGGGSGSYYEPRFNTTVHQDITYHTALEGFPKRIGSFWVTRFLLPDSVVKNDGKFEFGTYYKYRGRVQATNHLNNWSVVFPCGFLPSWRICRWRNFKGDESGLTMWEFPSSPLKLRAWGTKNRPNPNSFLETRLMQIHPKQNCCSIL